VSHKGENLPTFTPQTMSFGRGR